MTPDHTPDRYPLPGPRPEGDWLPTRPGTIFEFYSSRPWPVCWRCRLLGRLRLWPAYRWHRDRAHPRPRFVYLEDEIQGLMGDELWRGRCAICAQPIGQAPARPAARGRRAHVTCPPWPPDLV